MVAPFKGKKNEYQCPLCGRYASERNRYCSECFLVNPDQPGKPRSINMFMKSTRDNRRMPAVQLVAALAIGFLLGMGAFVIWDKQHQGTTSNTKDAPIQTQQQTGEGFSYNKPPTQPGVSTEEVDNSKNSIMDQWEDQTGQERTNTNDTSAANESNSGDKAEDIISGQRQGQTGQEEMKTNGTSR